MDDYKQSAVRHYESAEILNNQQKYDTSAHLLGLAAECAIKDKCNITRADLVGTHGHLPDLFTVALRKINKNNDKALHAILQKKFFADWSIKDRYSPNGKVTQEILNNWFTETKQIFRHTGIKKR